MRSILALAAAALLSACSHDGPLAAAERAGLAHCATGTAAFSVSPIALANVSGWVPLGNMAPPAHTLPTDHQYLYHTNPDRPGGVLLRAVDVVAPGSIVITGARRAMYSTGMTDYSVQFASCREIAGDFGHVTTLTPALLARVGAFDQSCSTYSPNPGLDVTQCYTKPIAVALSAGDAIGTAGGVSSAFALDFTLWDARVPSIRHANPARWSTQTSGLDDFHIVPASEYFAEPERSRIEAKVGSFDGKVHRTALPIGGTIEIDVSGSAQGSWFNPAQPRFPETSHLAIGPDNVDPSQIVVSMGLSQPNFPAGQYRFTPTSSGRTNRDPAQLAADGQIYCWQFAFGGALLVQLMDATTLRVEGRRNATSCATETMAFTAGGTFDYRR